MDEWPLRASSRPAWAAHVQEPPLRPSGPSRNVSVCLLPLSCHCPAALATAAVAAPEQVKSLPAHWPALPWSPAWPLLDSAAKATRFPSLLGNAARPGPSPEWLQLSLGVALARPVGATRPRLPWSRSFLARFPGSAQVLACAGLLAPRLGSRERSGVPPGRLCQDSSPQLLAQS